MTSSSYTVLRVAAGRCSMFEQHVQRLGEQSRQHLLDFARVTATGAYRAWWNGHDLRTEQRADSSLCDGLPAHFCVSPVAMVKGRFPKPAPPCVYDAVRAQDGVTLLTDAAGVEVYESSVAAVVAWDGEVLVLPPLDAPAVASVAEAAVAEAWRHRRAPIPVANAWPLLLINALGSCAPLIAGRGTFPPSIRRQINALLEAG